MVRSRRRRYCLQTGLATASSARSRALDKPGFIVAAAGQLIFAWYMAAPGRGMSALLRRLGDVEQRVMPRGGTRATRWATSPSVHPLLALIVTLAAWRNWCRLVRRGSIRVHR